MTLQETQVYNNDLILNADVTPFHAKAGSGGTDSDVLHP